MLLYMTLYHVVCPCVHVNLCRYDSAQHIAATILSFFLLLTVSVMQIQYKQCAQTSVAHMLQVVTPEASAMPAEVARQAAEERTRMSCGAIVPFMFVSWMHDHRSAYSFFVGSTV